MLPQPVRSFETNTGTYAGMDFQQWHYPAVEFQPIKKLKRGWKEERDGILMVLIKSGEGITYIVFEDPSYVWNQGSCYLAPLICLHVNVHVRDRQTKRFYTHARGSKT